MKKNNILQENAFTEIWGDEVKKVIFHVGFGKSGSSSIQSYLSDKSVLESTDGKKYIYCSLMSDGKLLFGDELKYRAKHNPEKYVSSVPDLTKITDFTELRHKIEELCEQGYTPIFSQEDWGRRGYDFLKSDVLKSLDVKIDVLAFVRPQVEWINSAWWQWHAWNQNFKIVDDVFDLWGFDFICWYKQLLSWKNMVTTSSVVVKPMIGDVLLQLFEYLAVDPAGINYKEIRNNSTLSLQMIKILKTYPQFRTEHASHVDFILSSVFDDKNKAPWVVSADLSKKIIHTCYEDNLKLSMYMGESDKKAFDSDLRWWDFEYYSNKTYDVGLQLSLSEKEKDEVISILLKHLMDGYGEKY